MRAQGIPARHEYLLHFVEEALPPSFSSDDHALRNTPRETPEQPVSSPCKVRPPVTPVLTSLQIAEMKGLSLYRHGGRTTTAGLGHATAETGPSVSIETTVQELDEIATHYQVEGCNIDNLKLVEMNANTIKFELRGSVDCQLQYGSDGDYARGDGVRVDDNYPLRCDLVANIADPLKLRAEGLRVDNSSFYE